MIYRTVVVAHEILHFVLFISHCTMSDPNCFFHMVSIHFILFFQRCSTLTVLDSFVGPVLSNDFLPTMYVNLA